MSTSEAKYECACAKHRVTGFSRIICAACGGMSGSVKEIVGSNASVGGIKASPDNFSPHKWVSLHTGRIAERFFAIDSKIVCAACGGMEENMKTARDGFQTSA